MHVVEGMPLVKQQCANLVAGMCLGMTTRGTLFRQQGSCTIAEGEQCVYYDVCLHPLTLIKKKVRKRRC